MRTRVNRSETGDAAGSVAELVSLYRSKSSLGMALDPLLWNKVLQFGLLHVGQECQNVLQILLSIDSPAAAAFDDGIEDRLCGFNSQTAQSYRWLGD